MAYFVAGFLCNCVLPVTLNSTKVRHHKIEDKQCDGEKEALTNESNKHTASSSISSSSSSPASTSGVRRGRSRSRRALPPSSPLIIGSPSSWCPKFEFFIFFSPCFVQLQKLLYQGKATDWIFNLKICYYSFYSSNVTLSRYIRKPGRNPGAHIAFSLLLYYHCFGEKKGMLICRHPVTCNLYLEEKSIFMFKYT